MKKKVASQKKIKLLRIFKNIIEKILTFSLLFLFGARNKIYGVIISEAFYLPWKDNAEFLRIYKKIKDYSMLDITRQFNIYLAVINSLKINGNVCEIGVWKGGTSFLIASILKKRNSNKKILAIDTFEGVIKATKRDLYYSGSEHAYKNKAFLENFKKKNKLNNLKIIQCKFPESFGPYKNNLKMISFSHIDVDTYKSLKETFEFVWPRLVKGGMVIFDDYGFHQTSATRNFILHKSKLKNCTFISYTNGQAAFIKK
ncbi:class I SAM-dependent methyltransferase [Candidatus Pelagibacter sp.]|nr:class I SAM-dependent methyltransferase [Candidatus Pelagibacter sp.]